jgi:hypothetical protein
VVIVSMRTSSSRRLDSTSAARWVPSVIDQPGFVSRRCEDSGNGQQSGD